MKKQSSFGLVFGPDFGHYQFFGCPDFGHPLYLVQISDELKTETFDTDCTYFTAFENQTSPEI